jgi:hypothetical protein
MAAACRRQLPAACEDGFYGRRLDHGKSRRPRLAYGRLSMPPADDLAYGRLSMPPADDLAYGRLSMPPADDLAHSPQAAQTTMPRPGWAADADG